MNRWKKIAPLIVILIVSLFAALPVSAQSSLTGPVVTPVLPVDGQVILPPTTKILTDAELESYIPPEVPCASPVFYIPPEHPVAGALTYIPPGLSCESPAFYPEYPVDGPWFYIPAELPCWAWGRTQRFYPFGPVPDCAPIVTDARCPNVYIPPEPSCLFPPAPALPCPYNPSEQTCEQVGCQVLRFAASTPLLESLRPGDVIGSGVTAKTPLGMLRRVVKIDPGTRSMIVAPATLEDAVQQGSVQHSGNLLSRKFVAYSGKGQAIPQEAAKPFLPLSLEAANAQGQKVRFTGGVSFGSTAGMNYNFTLGLSYKKVWSYDSVTLGLLYKKIWSFNYGATTDVKLVMETISAEGDVSFDQEFEAGRFLFEPVIIMMGRLPIVVAPELAVFVAAKGSVYAGMKARLEEGAIVSVGANYRDGQWTPFRKYSTMYSFSEPEAGGRAKFILSVKPQLFFKFYGIAGPATALEVSAIPAIDAARNPWWQLYGQLRGVLSVSTGVIGCSLGNPQWPLIDWGQLVAQASGPFPLYPTISGTVTDMYGVPVSGVQMIFNPGTTVSTDARGFYINKVPAGWSGTVTPYRSGSDFGPRYRSYTNVRTNITDQNYVMTQGSQR